MKIPLLTVVSLPPSILKFNISSRVDRVIVIVRIVAFVKQAK